MKTCRWFLNHRTFQAWKNSDHADLLWLSADPGCGKSVLSRALIDDVLALNTSVIICYFFFKDNKEQNTTATALCALLHQLFCERTDLFQKHAENVIKLQGEKLKFNFESLWKLWMSATSDSSSGNIICVLDGLDECNKPDRERLIQELKRFYTTCQGKKASDQMLKFLVTSRPYGDIERGFGTLTYQFPHVRLAGEEEWKDISNEVSMVMDAKIDDIVTERGLSDEIRDALKHRLSEIENRTYLWLHLMLDVLRDFHGTTKSKLLQEIDQLPESIDEAYEEILGRCNRSVKQDGRRLLEIIVAAQRPLTLSEVDVAMEIHPSSKAWKDLDLAGSSRKQWVRDVCGLFVSIIDSRIYLIHQTAREFLIRQGNLTATSDKWGHSIDLQKAHFGLAKLCIGYLHFSDFWRQHQQPVHRSAPQDAFLQYSAAHWMYHVQQGGDMESEWICAAAKLCEVGESLFYIQSHGDTMMWTGLTKSQTNPLYWAIRWELILIVEFLAKDSEIKITEEVVRAAAGSQFSGAKIMELLFDQREAEVKITDEVVRAAAENQSSGVKIIELLLDRRGAKVKVTDEVVRAAMENQSSGTQIMELLLDQRGAEIKITDELIFTAAGYQSSGPKILELLLQERGTKVRITSEVISCVFTMFGHKVKELLLDRQEAKINIANEVVQTVGGNWYDGFKIMEPLINGRGSKLKITEEVAHAIAGNIYYGAKIMEILLDQQGAEIDITDKVVRAAAGNLSSGAKIMELLLSRRGAEINITDEVVCAAAGNQSSGAKIMEFLLNRRGAEIKITNKVVQTAVGNKYRGVKIMELLLDRRRAEIKITDEVVRAAAGNQSSGAKIMELLRDQE